MNITLHLSGGLRAVLGHLPGKMTIHMEEPATLRHILAIAGINPLIVMQVAVGGKRGDKDQVIDHDAEITLMGPMAGG